MSQYKLVQLLHIPRILWCWVVYLSILHQNVIAVDEVVLQRGGKGGEGEGREGEGEGKRGEGRGGREGRGGKRRGRRRGGKRQ